MSGMVDVRKVAALKLCGECGAPRVSYLIGLKGLRHR
jgi:hypothetical protein